VVLAVVFDLQGTCADFYRPVLRAGADVDPAEPSCDLNVADFVELAAALGC
jgi:hypothetical protein